MTFIKLHGVYLGFWLLVMVAMLVGARLWLVNPIVRELRRLSQG